MDFDSIRNLFLPRPPIRLYKSNQISCISKMQLCFRSYAFFATAFALLTPDLILFIWSHQDMTRKLWHTFTLPVYCEATSFRDPPDPCQWRTTKDFQPTASSKLALHDQSVRLHFDRRCLRTPTCLYSLILGSRSGRFLFRSVSQFCIPSFLWDGQEPPNNPP